MFLIFSLIHELKSDIAVLLFYRPGNQGKGAPCIVPAYLNSPRQPGRQPDHLAGSIN